MIYLETPSSVCGGPEVCLIASLDPPTNIVKQSQLDTQLELQSHSAFCLNIELDLQASGLVSTPTTTCGLRIRLDSTPGPGLASSVQYLSTLTLTAPMTPTNTILPVFEHQLARFMVVQGSFQLTATCQ